MVEATRLEDTGRKEQPMEEDDGRAAPDTISEQEMDEVCCNHLHILRQLTSTTWLPRQFLPRATTVGSWDVLKPALLAYQVAADIGKKSWELLSEWNFFFFFFFSFLSSFKKCIVLHVCWFCCLSAFLNIANNNPNTTLVCPHGLTFSW